MYSMSHADPRISMETWFDHFRNLFQGNIDMNTYSFDDNVTELLRHVNISEGGLNCDILNDFVTENEVNCVIGNLKNNKTCGIDAIPSEFFKNSIESFLHVFTKLFNAILTSGYYPKAWSVGMIIPVHKKGVTSDPGNYRGISLLNVFSKIFTGILNKRLKG